MSAILPAELSVLVLAYLLLFLSIAAPLAYAYLTFRHLMECVEAWREAKPVRSRVCEALAYALLFAGAFAH